MSKRLQVMIEEQEFKAVQRASRDQHLTVAEWVRTCIRAGLETKKAQPPEAKIAAILQFAKHTGPTGKIEDILAAIETGRAS